MSFDLPGAAGYDWLIGIDFGSTETKIVKYRTATSATPDVASTGERYPSSCLILCNNEEYEVDLWMSFGGIMTYTGSVTNGGGKMLCIDELGDKVEHLSNAEADVTGRLEKAKDRLYLRAVINYFKMIIRNYLNQRGTELNVRYFMTYPSSWTTKQVAYLKFLAQTSGIVQKDSDPDLLVFYSEGECILRLLQEPYIDGNIEQGCRYLICDMGGSTIRMCLYDITEPPDAKSHVKGVRYCNWDVNYINELSQFSRGLQNIRRLCESYILSKIPLPSKLFIKRNHHYNDLQPLRVDFNKLVDDVMQRIMQGLNKKAMERNEPIVYRLFFSVNPLKLNFTSLKLERSPSRSTLRNEAFEPKLSQEENGLTLTLIPAEIEKRVLNPVCGEVIQYLQSIFQKAGNYIESMILVGDLSELIYLKELITETCKRENTKILHPQIPFSGSSDANFHIRYPILYGAYVKDLDRAAVRMRQPTVKPYRRVFNGRSPEFFVFIDYGKTTTSVSYIYKELAKNPDSANIKHITDWPGQSASSYNFPTIEVMLIPSGERIFSLKENADPNKHLLRLKGEKERCDEYLTFTKCKQRIIMHTHRASEAPQSIAQSNFTVTSKQISVQEFSLIYFKYLTAFVYNYVHQRSVAGKYIFRFCITHDSNTGPDTLANSDIKYIAENCGILRANCKNTLKTLERSRSTAIYCRKLINGRDTNGSEMPLHFIQVQLNQNQCELILNDSPNPNVMKTRNDKEEWTNIYKYAKSKTVAVSFMDIFCENLWIRVESLKHTMLEACNQHRGSHQFFNSKNMQVFREQVKKYVSTANLNIRDGKKVNKIRICKTDHEGDCCRINITNEDLLEFAVAPAINSFTSIIRAGIMHLCLGRELLVRNIFVMGALLSCRYYRDYEFLEKFLLISLHYSDFQFIQNSDLLSFVKTTTINVTKVDSIKKKDVKYIHGDDDIEEFNEDSLERVVVGGSVIYGINPWSCFLERYTIKGYFVSIEIKSLTGNSLNQKHHCSKDESFVTYEQFGSCRTVHSKFKSLVLERRTPLKDKESTEEEIRATFKIHNYSEDVSVCIDLFQEGESKKLYGSAEELSDSEPIKTFSFGPTNSTYPIVFKARTSQTQSNRFWVEYGQNERTESFVIREKIQLNFVD